MVAIIIGTHGKLSQELLRASEMIYGKQNNITTIDFEPEEGTHSLKIKYEEALRRLDISKGVLILVDLFGGSPYNVVINMAMDREEIQVITGVNLPMILGVYSLREKGELKELVEVAQSSGKLGIIPFKRNSEFSSEEDFE